MRGGATLALTSLEAVVEDVLRSTGLNKPFSGGNFALFGHSFGALVMHAVAVALRESGLPQPSHLIVAAEAAPMDVVPVVDPDGLDDASLVQQLLAMGLIAEETAAAGADAKRPRICLAHCWHQIGPTK